MGIAFLAMAEFRLGRVEDAKRHLEDVRLMRTPSRAGNSQDRRFAAEAEALVGR